MTSCPLCGSEQTSAVSARDRFGRRVKTWLCEHCGLVFNAPHPKPKALIAAYVEEHQGTPTAPIEPDLARTRRLLARYERTIPEYWPLLKDGKRLLDVCAGGGEFAFVMGRLGYEVEALDPCPAHAAHARQVLGIDVQAVVFTDKTYPAKRFDIIRVYHLLAHCADPVAQLRRLREWLTDDGLIYLELPNIEAEAETRSKGDLFDAGHVISFNPTTLRLAMAEAGFVEAVETSQRLGHGTAGYFRKAEAPVALRPDPENARRVSDAITRHYTTREALSAKLGHFARAIARRGADQKAAKGLEGGHRQAAEEVAGRLKAALGR